MPPVLLREYVSLRDDYPNFFRLVAYYIGMIGHGYGTSDIVRLGGINNGFSYLFLSYHVIYTDTSPLLCGI